MNARLVTGIVVAAALAAGGCKKPREVILTKEQRARIQDSILKAPPALAKRLDANLDNSIKLLGVELDKSEVKPGDSLRVTYYWECLKEVKGEWKVFAHLERMQERKRQILDHIPVAELYPISQWKKGEVIKDTQEIRVDADFKAGEALLWVGVYNEQTWRERQANDRLPVVNKTEVQQDGENRVRAASVVVLGKPGEAAAKPPVKPKEYRLVQIATPIVVDGKLDDAAWASAPTTGKFASPDGKPAPIEFACEARALWDGQSVYFGFTVADNDIVSDRTGRDAKLWEQDAVEVYLDPGADGKDYVEIQVSPAGQIFDARFASHREPPWEEASKAFNIEVKAAVALDGSINKSGDGVGDKGWTVELAIPLAALPGGVPRTGDRWAMNLFRVGDKAGPDMSAWAPVGGDFHDLSKAGRLLFAPPITPETATTAGPEAVPAKPAEAAPAARPAVAPVVAPVAAPAAKPAAMPAKPAK